MKRTLKRKTVEDVNAEIAKLKKFRYRIAKRDINKKIAKIRKLIESGSASRIPENVLIDAIEDALDRITEAYD